MDSDEEETDSELGRPLFDANASRSNTNESPPALSAMPRAVQAAQDRDAEDVWAELG